MKRKIIRLTENDLKNIVKKSVYRILNEGWNKDKTVYILFQEEYGERGTVGIFETPEDAFDYLVEYISKKYQKSQEEIAAEFNDDINGGLHGGWGVGYYDTEYGNNLWYQCEERKVLTRM